MKVIRRFLCRAAFLAAALSLLAGYVAAEERSGDLKQSSAPQRPAVPDVQAQKEAIDKIGFILGKWEGTGSIVQGPNTVEFRQTEDVRLHLDGALIIVDGRGYSREPDAEAPIFSAFAVISYNDTSEEYEFRSYSRGYSYTSKGEFIDDNVFQWSIGPVRYKTWLSTDGKWIEIGERETVPGTWVQFFKMELTRTE